jgi:hypothetical protein
MPTNQPRIDHVSLAQLGRELQAAHHTSEKEPLSDRQKDLLLEWAVKEAIEAAEHGRRSPYQPSPQDGVVAPVQPPQAPRPIATAPRALDKSEKPVVLLLYAPEQGGWHTGYWSMGEWRTHLHADVCFKPTHWLPPMLGPQEAAE